MPEMPEDTTLDQDAPDLIDALSATLALTFGQESIYAETIETGGGCTAAMIDLSIDGRLLGRQIWLTREADDWLCAFYDFRENDEDEGVCVTLFTPGDRVDDPLWIASQVAGILHRLGVTNLLGDEFLA